MMLPRNALSQIRPKLPFKVDALFQSQVVIPVVVKPIFLRSIPESLCGYLINIAEVLLVSCYFLCRIIALRQDRLIFLSAAPLRRNCV